ncbi:MAG: serine/threonine protein kinase [Deltaproteobacteria bacterium]|nr:serine/threonine protein kinase [Deltaproteobacteria bacterium]
MNAVDVLKPGSRIGKYRVIRRVGVGGMAEVFVATAEGVEGFEKRVALKRMLPFVGESSDFERRFVREAQISARLQHPNIGQVFDFGKEDGHLYIALEYVDGIDLAHILSESRDQGFEIPFGVITGIITGLTSGLRYAHEAKGADKKPLGLVHRDVTPSNILVSYSGHAKLIDFGIAKATQEVTQSSDGSLKGKLRYMSPEQINAVALDGRADVFAAGVVLWEMITLERLFQAPSSAAILRLISSPETPLPSTHRPDVPRRLEDIALKALERDRESRYQSARDMLADLEAFARDERLDTSADSVAEFVEDLVPRQTVQPAFAHLATQVLPKHPTETTASGKPVYTRFTPPEDLSAGKVRGRWLAALALMTAVLMVGGFLAWQKLGATATEPSEASTPAGGEPSSAEPIAPAEGERARVAGNEDGAAKEADEPEVTESEVDKTGPATKPVEPSSGRVRKIKRIRKPPKPEKKPPPPKPDKDKYDPNKLIP